MASEDVTLGTTETSESSEVEPSTTDTSKSLHETKILADDSEETKKGSEGEHPEDCFKTKIEIMVQLGSEILRPFTLSDCYTSSRTGMYLEILPKIIFDTDDDTDLEEVDLPKPIFRQIADQGTQASIEHKSSKAQTLRSKYVNSWSQYEPRLATDEEVDENLICHSFQSFKHKAEKSTLDALVQNTIADCFFWDLTSLFDDEIHLGKEAEPILTISGSFSCSENDSKERMITSVHWHPLQKDIFVSSTVDSLGFELRTKNLLEPESDSTLFYMWSAKNQFFPKLKLEYFDDLHVLRFNPSLPNLIAGGSVTGQLILWDLRKEILSIDNVIENEETSFSSSGGFTSPPVIRCCAISNMDHIHKYGITDLVWMPNHSEVIARGELTKSSSNISYQIATCGLDGLLHFWDLRMGFQLKPGQSGPRRFQHLDGVWEPFHSIEVFAPESRQHKSLTCFTLRTNIKVDTIEIPIDSTDSNVLELDEEESSEIESMNTEFYGGCDDGQVLCGNFRLFRDEAGKFIVRHPDYFMSPHNRAITMLACSPFLNDVFLSTGGKSIAIWKHNIKSQPVYLRERSTYITSGQWSPSRPALFILGLDDGSVEIWDLLNNRYEPHLVHFMSTSSIKSVTIQAITETEHILAAGDSKGVVYSLVLPSGLWISQENELEKTKQIIETEANRIHEPTPEGSEVSVLSERVKPKDQSKKLAEIIQEVEVKEDDIIAERYQAFLEFQNMQLRDLGLLKVQSDLIPKDE